MANLITLGRLLLLFVVVAMAYWIPAGDWLIMLSVPLLIVVFVGDAIDGYIARKRNETSVFGAILDISVDRMAELTLWVVMVDLDMVAVWVALVFIVRGSLVDAIRAGQTTASQRSPFDQVQNRLARWLVAGRFMRGFYAAIKGIVFCWLLLIMPLPDLVPGLWANWGWLLSGIGTVLVWTTVFLCVIRGVPVVAEFLADRRAALRPAA